MKRLLQIIVIVLIFYSCKKSDESSIHIDDTGSISNTIDTTSNPNGCHDPRTSYWSFKGINYCGINTINDTVDFGVDRDVLKSSDGVSDSVAINFWSDPLVTSTFIVNNGAIPTPRTGTCTIVVYHGNDLYVSTDFDSCGIVNVVITGDAITASFSNVPVMKHDTSYLMETISGTLIKQ